MVFTVDGRLTVERLVQPEKSSVPMDGRLPSSVTLTSPVQPLKAALPILFTRSISTVLRLTQPLKASLPIDLAVVISMERRLWHPSKALLPMSLMASGIWILSSSMQSLKASLPMSVTDWGRTMLLRRSQRAKVVLLMALMLASCRLIFSSVLQLANAATSINSTDSGTSMLSSAIHPSKAWFSMTVSELGSFTSLRLVHPLKA